MGDIGKVVSGGVSLFGGGNKGEKAALAAQKDNLEVQTKIAKQQLDQYKTIGIPGYQSALRGLLASYGYRTPDQGTHGSTVGSRPLFSDQGTFGYNETLGQNFGATADKWTAAKKRLQERAAAEGLAPAVVAEAMRRLDADQANEMQMLELQSRREGPLALLQALAPALGAGSAGAQTAAGAAAGAVDMGNSARTLNNDWLNSMMQLGTVLGTMTGKKTAIPGVNTGGVVAPSMSIPLIGGGGLITPQAALGGGGGSISGLSPLWQTQYPLIARDATNGSYGNPLAAFLGQ